MILTLKIPRGRIEEFTVDVEEAGMDGLPNKREAVTFLKQFRMKGRGGSLVYGIPVTPDTVLHLESFAKLVYEASENYELIVESEQSELSAEESANVLARVDYYRETASTILTTLKEYDGFPRLVIPSATSARPDCFNVPEIPVRLGRLAQ